jgi:hypothetical protein
VLDLFFSGPALAPENLKALDGVAGLCWLHPEVVELGEIAFSSVRRATELFCAQRGRAFTASGAAGHDA